MELAWELRSSLQVFSAQDLIQITPAWVPASGAALVTKPKNRRVFKKITRTGAAATVRVSGSPGNEFVYYRDESQEVR